MYLASFLGFTEFILDKITNSNFEINFQRVLSNCCRTWTKTRRSTNSKNWSPSIFKTMERPNCSLEKQPTKLQKFIWSSQQSPLNSHFPKWFWLCLHFWKRNFKRFCHFEINQWQKGTFTPQTCVDWSWSNV